MFSYHQKLLEHSVLRTFTTQGGMNGLNRIDFLRSRKVDAAVGGNATQASVGVSIWQRWMVGTMYISGHHSPPAPTAPSKGPKGWCGAGPSNEPP